MSASTERKNRQAAIQAGTDKKAQAAQAEAKKQAKSRRSWTIGIIAVVVLVALTLVLSSDLLYTGTTAVTIDGVKYSPAQVNYRYAEQYYAFTSQYGSYASMFGLNTANGPFALADQPCSMTEDGKGSWRDYFLQAAYNGGMTLGMTQIQGLTRYAAANGITLDDEEKAEIQSDMQQLETLATTNGYTGTKHFLQANYGAGVTAKLATRAAEDTALAYKAYNSYLDSLNFSEDELETYYASLNGERELFSYVSYYLAAETTPAEAGSETEGEESAAEQIVTDEARAAARDKAERVLAAFAETEGEDYAARVTEALGAAGVDGAASESRSVSGSSLNAAYKEWMLDAARRSGDSTVVDAESGDGSYVVVYVSRNDNHYKTANVRHILINAVADEDGTYSDEALATARARAEEILAEWKSGDATEDSFAALAGQYSEDNGSNTNGGLYENVAQGQMVAEFNDFLFAAGRKSGDTGIVYGSNGSYAGYHVMYDVGEGEQYSDLIAKNALQSDAMTTWMDEITPKATPAFFEKLAGK